MLKETKYVEIRLVDVKIYRNLLTESRVTRMGFTAVVVALFASKESTFTIG